MTDINLDQAEGALKDGGAAVVDIREASEYAEGHVPGVVHIPMAQVPARAAEFDKSKPIYLICASGNRSTTMAETLNSAGFQAFSVAGGTTAWAESGRPIERN